MDYGRIANVFEQYLSFERHKDVLCSRKYSLLNDLMLLVLDKLKGYAGHQTVKQILALVHREDACSVDGTSVAF